MKIFTQSLILFAVFLIGLNAQTVSGQVSTGTPPQTATATKGFKKVPTLTISLACPGVPTDPVTGDFLVVAATSVTCFYAVNVAPTAAATVTNTSSDLTAFTVPASVQIAANALTSANFLVTATP